MKKGFTLIELLAVIVILAVIAVIAIPIIMNIIEDARKNSAIQSANGYVRAVNYKIAQEILNEREVDEEIDYVIGENELSVTGNNLDGIIGSYSLSNSRVLWAGLCVNGYSVEYNAATGYTGISSRNFCGEEPYVFDEPEAELMSVACTDSSKYTSEDTFKIYTVEDLVCLSNLVNGGKDFTGKTIYLLRDIDFNSDKSYKDKDTTVYGDINGDSTTSDLKTELTTGAGFKPIGNNSNKFNGTFLGYAYTISNLMINKNSQYLGLFGYNTGVIKGVRFRNANISSTYNNVTYAGIVAGYSTGIVNSVEVSGDVVISDSAVGGIVGYSTGVVDNALFSGTVQGYNYVGGLIGRSEGTSSNLATAKGVVYDSTITVAYTNNPFVGKTIGNVGNTTYKSFNANTTSFTGRRAGGKDGMLVSTLTLEGIDEVIDTYIGGDNDSDSYYFDYNSDENIVLYSINRNPIQANKLKGSGTETNPYLIEDTNDWKLASSTVIQGKYYSVENDIDFTDQKYYAFGTNANKFNGHINGNMHTISNVSLLGYDYVGIFGYNTGTIQGFNFDGITIATTGRNLGTVAGYNTGTIKGINATNVNISSTYNGNTETSSGDYNTYVGGITGYNSGIVESVAVKGILGLSKDTVGGIIGYNAGQLNSSIFEGTITANDYAGGLIGKTFGVSSSNLAIVNGVVQNSSITTSKTWSYTGKVFGQRSNTTANKIYSINSTVTTNGRRESGTDGTSLTTLTIEGVDGALDTTIGGDTDSNGYYFDICNGNVVLLSTILNPVETYTCIVE